MVIHMLKVPWGGFGHWQCYGPMLCFDKQATILFVSGALQAAVQGCTYMLAHVCDPIHIAAESVWSVEVSFYITLFH